MDARDIMVEDVHTVSPEDDVSDVFHAFARVSFSGFPVVDETDRVVGVITESDLVDLFEPDTETFWIPIGLPPFVDTLTYQVEPPWADLDLGVDLVRSANKPIRSVMTSDPVTVHPDADLDTLLSHLAADDPNVNRLPVVDDDGVLCGLVARQDVIRAIRAERSR